MTQEKSDESDTITNENIAARNKLIATLANQKDIFYIDINESSLCKEGALVSDYTWGPSAHQGTVLSYLERISAAPRD